MSDKNITVVIVGMGFGKEFIPIYQRHPNIKAVGICTRNKNTLAQLAATFTLDKNLCFEHFDDIPGRDDVDAIHIVTPVPEHAQMEIASLNANKHTACTIPMAMTLEDCKAIVAAKRKAKKVYMMMETALYTREFLYGLELAQSGKLGRIQFVRGSHIQDMSMEGWAEYWKGYPPMLNGTHAISPDVLHIEEDWGKNSCESKQDNEHDYRYLVIPQSLWNELVKFRFHQDSPPTAYFIIASSVASSRFSSPAMRPLCITRMRWLFSRISGNSDEIRITPIPFSHSSRITP